jgi:hypothetical protein
VTVIKVNIKVKVKVTLEQATAQRGVDVYLYAFFNLGAKWGLVVNATPRPLYPLERTGTSRIGDWVGLRVGLDRFWKI